MGWEPGWSLDGGNGGNGANLETVNWVNIEAIDIQDGLVMESNRMFVYRTLALVSNPFFFANGVLKGQ